MDVEMYVPAHDRLAILLLSHCVVGRGRYVSSGETKCGVCWGK